MINKIITSIFYYTAKDIDGKIIKDQEEHNNITALITSLHRKNLLYITSRRHYRLRFAAYSRPPKKQIHHFIKQLLSGSYVWFVVVVFGLVLSYLCIFSEALIIKYFSPSIAKFMMDIYKKNFKK